ncbi:hypothetical protein AJ79_00605 [Helicocarpus griseus UAMH5409]|uniref:VLRF1 domain-containing protein n=1 Tax=Helicocarpus griseus UAMH5409 TaxID=1447875 RepID=A0A2B7Y9R3_9EURO|nr:hypothetical protein AJ79_00605 [Helicocarpus griseus UAMH5409]
MAGDTQRGEELLKRPLYVFDLPTELLASLSAKSSGVRTPIPLKQDERVKTLERGDKEDGVASVTSCSLCEVSFQNAQEHREHARSDHHRYNMKSRLRGTPVLNEAEFNKAIGELDESISGSESSSDEEEEDFGEKTQDSTLTALLKKQAKISITAEAEEIIAKKKNNPGKHPLLWFSSPLLPQNTSLGVYRGLFTNIEQEETDHLVESLQNKQCKALPHQANKAAQAKEPANQRQQASPHIFLCMIGGGHFAAMVVALAPEINRKAGGAEERHARVIAHKTFHRYTTRRKQGGAQSASDAAASGAAHSAGASIRRHNEAALQNEIRQLLSSWKEMIDDANLLFVRATGNTNRRILFGPYDGQVLRQSDARLRGFPFTTRRATQAELMRAFTELTRVKVSHVDEAALALEAEKQREAQSKSPKPSSQQQKQKPKISKEEEEQMLHTTQIQALIRRSKAPALVSYISTNSISPTFTFHPSSSQQTHHSPTPLHLAASSNSPAIVLALLTKANSDPTQLNGDSKPPFDLAGDRATRDAFRVARHELGESKWDWDAAHVPAPLSKADADGRTERERQAAAEAEASRRKAETERLKREDAERAVESRRRAGGRTLMEKTGAEKREEDMRGMTPEMRLRLERERRARAAEERIRRMQGGGS